MLNIKTQEDYNNIIASIKECINFYNDSYPIDNKYTLYLGNGRKITYSINENNIPHLLGIRIDNFISMDLFRKDSYYNILNKFISENYSIYKKIALGGYLKYSDIFSNYIEYKLEYFKNQLKAPYLSDIYFICEYDTTKTYQSKEVDEYTSDYYIARKVNNGDIMLLGLKRRTIDEYALQTSRIIKKDEHQLEVLKEFLRGQVITFANSLKIENYQTGYNKEYHIGIEAKKETIQTLINLSRNTYATPNTIRNHLFDIVGVSKTKNDTFNKRIILSQLVSCMKNSHIFDFDELEDEVRKSIDEETIEVINNYNNYICSSPVTSDDNSQKYSDVLDERDRLYEENISFKNRLEDMQNQMTELTKQKEELEKYKALYLEFTGKIYALANEEQAKNEI